MGQGGGFERWREVSDRARLHVLELPSSSGLGRNIIPRGGDNQDGGGQPGEAQWFEIHLDPAGDGARIYHSLFGEGLPVGVQSANKASPADMRRLTAAFDLASHTATQQQIDRALARVGPIELIGVYDVGQGSMNGLCTRDGLPRAYFDLGGGVLANAKSFSSLLQNICFTTKPPVILSHWDWDHWSSATRFPHSQSLTWIVPNQRLGAVHAAMAAAISLSGKLLVWPPGLALTSVGQVRIEKCTGSSGRNHTGLAALVSGPAGQDPILLTGDARYSAIPSGMSSFHSIVIAHHGADMGSKQTPICSGNSAARVAYSYGKGNTFGHPRSCTYSRHHAKGWPHCNLQPVGFIDRHTSALRPQLGHIALGWAPFPTLPRQPCRGGMCSLQLAQW
jgi:hypothetical protein